MPAGSDPSPRAAPSGPDVSSVASDLEAIFAEAAPASGEPAQSSKVRAVSGRRARVPYATLGAVAAAGLVGLTAGTLMVRAQATPQAAAVAPTHTLPVQVAAPTVTMPATNSGPIPVLDNEPVTARAAPTRALHKAPRHAGHGDLMAADRRLRAAYSHAIQAGVPRHVLAAYRDRWSDLREDASWRPDRVAAGYGAMTADLERLARRSHGRRPAPRRGLFGLFS